MADGVLDSLDPCCNEPIFVLSIESLTMAETWLRTNARLSLAAALATLFVCLLSVLAALGWMPFVHGSVGSGLAWGLSVGALAASLAAFWSSRRPRLAYNAGELLVHMRPGAPIRVPIELVECFLMGRAPSYLPRRRDAKTETSTVVVRLRPQVEEFSHVNVEPRLGSWCDSHIIIRGTWSQPIDIELLHELNRRLYIAQQSSTLDRGPR